MQNFKQFDFNVRKERYDATEQAMTVFERKFSIKSSCVDQVLAFKGHIVDIFKKQEHLKQAKTLMEKSLSDVSINLSAKQVK